MKAAKRLLSVKSRPTVSNVSKLAWDDLIALNSGPGGVNAFVTPVGPERAGSYRVALKDNICTKDLPTTCSSAMLQRFNPPYDATVVRLLKGAGATVVGKTNCDEFGMGSANVYSHHGPVINPHPMAQDGTDTVETWRQREKRSAGGSSGGSAAAVAMGLCNFALGTDTGGSIRLPAAYCGVVGFKPSYGLISRWGVVSFADSLDCVGILAKDANMIRNAFDILSVHDPADPTCVTNDIRLRIKEQERRQQDKRTDTSRPLHGITIGIPLEYFPLELDPAIKSRFQKVLEKLSEAGATLQSVSLPSTHYALSAYYVISSAEASSNLARYDGVQYGEFVQPDKGFKGTTGDVYALTRSKHFGPEVKRRILLGTYALTAAAFDNYFLQAQRLRRIIRHDFDQVFKSKSVLSRESDLAQNEASPHSVDFLLHPSAIRTAPKLEETAPNDSLDSYVQDIMTVPASLAGLPAISLASGFGEDGWPLGVSFVGQWGSDRNLLQTASSIESIL
ncbi:amidase signature enzyme [Serendipita vermifera]|nr:amidase signature enzyme [Serendipita vermifera]